MNTETKQGSMFRFFITVIFLFVAISSIGFCVYFVVETFKTGMLVVKSSSSDAVANPVPVKITEVPDPDKDHDGLEDSIIEKYVYTTDVTKADTNGNGVSDGNDMYKIYKDAVLSGDEKVISAYESLFEKAKKEHNQVYGNAFVVGDIEEVFNIYKPELKGYLTLAQSYNVKQQYDKAKEILNKGIQIEPRYVPFYWQLALLVGNVDGDVDKEIELLQTAITYDFRNPAAHYYMSTALSSKNNMKGALVEAKIAMDLNPYDNEYVSTVARFYVSLKDTKKSKELENFLFSDANINSLTLISVGTVYTADKKYELAEKFFRKAIEIDPHSYEAYRYLGQMFSSMKKNDLAESAFRKEIEVNPNNSEAYYDLGWYYTYHGKAREAIVLYEKAISLDPNKVGLYIVMASAYEALNDKKNQLLYYKKALVLTPEDQNLKDTIQNFK